MWVTNEEAEALLKQLSEHYSEPVMPVRRYCQAFEDWGRALNENGHELSQYVNIMVTAIYKSNLLARLIYGGEKLRTKKCPVHQGTWSGCSFPDDSLPNFGRCECQRNERGEWDGNVCGWIADEPPKT